VYLSSLPRHVANPAGPPRPPEDTKPNIETGGRDFRRPCTTIALAHRLPSRLIPAAAWHDRVLPYDQRRIAHLRGPLPHRGHFSPSVMAIVLAAIGQDGAVHPVFFGGDAGEVQGPTQRISSQLLTDGMTQPVPRQRFNRASISAAGIPALRDFVVHSSAFECILGHLPGSGGHVQTRNSRAIR
jgi:hypothetical protein